MSIHTILSQMEEEFDKKFVIRTGTKKIKRVGYYCTKDSDSHVGHDPKLILDFFRSFATRIVEETRNECLPFMKSVEYEVTGEPVQDEENLKLLKFYDSITGTKLQKMKGDL